MNASSVRSNPMPAAPAARPASASATVAALTRTSIRRPSRVTDGSAAEASALARASRRRACAAPAAARRWAAGSATRVPASPSTTTIAPCATFSTSAPSPTAIGMPSPRATTAAWADGAPAASAMAAVVSRSSATSAGPEVLGDEHRKTRLARPHRLPARLRRHLVRHDLAASLRAGLAHQPRGPAAERVDVVGAGREQGIRERGDRVGVHSARRQQRRRGRPAGLEHRGFELAVERGVGRHQDTGLDDLRLRLAPLGAQPPTERFQLGARRHQRRARRRQLGLAGGARRHRRGRGRAAQDARRAGSRAGRCRQAPQHELRHQPEGVSARPSVARISAVEVAPGSWWPIERSPR